MAALKKKETLTKALSKRPKLGPEEWDFRWVKSQVEAEAVYYYELGREILRESRYALKSEQKYEKLLQHLTALRSDNFSFSPIDDDELAHALRCVVEISKGLKLISGLPPCSCLVKERIRKQLSKTKPRARLLIRRQQAGVIDAFDIEHGPDKVFELIFSDFDYPTKKEVKQILDKWIDDTRYFPEEESGRPTNPLIKLAVYRFTQQDGENKPYYRFREELIKQKTKAETFGESLYAKYTHGNKTASQSSWSGDINTINKNLSGKIKLLLRVYGLI